MKKICLSLMTVLMVSSIGFANTIEKDELSFLKEIQLISNNNTNDEFIRICYLMSVKSVEPVDGVVVTTSTYWCVNHPEIPGNETIYINGK